MTFTKPWASLTSQPSDPAAPLLPVSLRMQDGRFIRQLFVVDSGADVCLGPRRLCVLLGLTWEAGIPVELRGIAPGEECVVKAMIHTVELRVHEAKMDLSLPFCFADGAAPLLLGREGFFDAFRILFDKRNAVTTFEW